MRPITFTAEDRRALAHDRYHSPDPHVQRKMEVPWLKSHGLGPDAITASADVSRRTVQRDLDETLEGGLSRLRRCRWHQPHSALAEYQDSLEGGFLEHPPRSAQQAQTVIEQRAGVRRGLSQVRHVLRDRLGRRWRQTGAIPVPPKKSVEGHAREPAAFLRDEREPRSGAGAPEPEAGRFRRCRPLQLRALAGLLVVRSAAVRAGGVGP